MIRVLQALPEKIDRQQGDVRIGIARQIGCAIAGGRCFQSFVADQVRRVIDPLLRSHDGEPPNLRIRIGQRDFQRLRIRIACGIQGEQHEFTQRWIGVFAQRQPQGGNGVGRRLHAAVRTVQRLQSFRRAGSRRNKTVFQTRQQNRFAAGRRFLQTAHGLVNHRAHHSVTFILESCGNIEAGVHLAKGVDGLGAHSGIGRRQQRPDRIGEGRPFGPSDGADRETLNDGISRVLEPLQQNGRLFDTGIFRLQDGSRSGRLEQKKYQKQKHAPI